MAAKSFFDTEFGKQLGTGARVLLESAAGKFFGGQGSFREDAKEAKRNFDDASGRDTNPYQTLGLRPDADNDIVKAAYRSLSRKYHPDSGKSPDGEKMKEVNRAWETIKRERGL